MSSEERAHAKLLHAGAASASKIAYLPSPGLAPNGPRRGLSKTAKERKLLSETRDAGYLGPAGGIISRWATAQSSFFRFPFVTTFALHLNSKNTSTRYEFFTSAAFWTVAVTGFFPFFPPVRAFAFVAHWRVRSAFPLLVDLHRTSTLLCHNSWNIT